MATSSYENIDRPYGSDMLRSTSGLAEGEQATPLGGDATDLGGPTANVEAFTDKSSYGDRVISDEESWFGAWIKSRNYKPKEQGILLDSFRGYGEFAELFIGRRGAHFLERESGVNSSPSIFIENYSDYPAIHVEKYLGSGGSPADAIYVKVGTGASFGLDIDQYANTAGIHVISRVPTSGTTENTVPIQLQNDNDAQQGTDDYWEIAEYRGGSAPEVSVSQWVGTTSPNGVLDGSFGDILQSEEGKLYINTDNGTTWAEVSTSANSENSFFGSGSDGSATISADTTLTGTKYYTDLTIDAGKTLNTGDFHIFVKGTLTINGTLSNKGANGAAGAAASGSTKGAGSQTATGSDVGTVGKKIGVTSAANAGNGGEGATSPVAGADGTSVGNAISTAVNGGTGGPGGDGGTSAGAPNPAQGHGNGGANGNITGYARPEVVGHPVMGVTMTSVGYSNDYFRHVAGSGSGGGGGRGAYDGGTAGAGGGGGANGSSGGVVVVFAKNIVNNGTITAKGGDGGVGGVGGNAVGPGDAAGGGGGGGGSGGSGGWVLLFYKNTSGAGTITVAGGTGGAGGAGGTGVGLGTSGSAGSTGNNGQTGTIQQIAI